MDVDAEDDGDDQQSLRRWVEDANRDFAARMDWCVANDYKDANHPPTIKLKGKRDLSVSGGETIVLFARASSDPDGDDFQYDLPHLSFLWFNYSETGTLDKPVPIRGAENAHGLYMNAPEVDKEETNDMILKVTDKGTPALSWYKQIFVTVVPE